MLIILDYIIIKIHKYNTPYKRTKSHLTLGMHSIILFIITVFIIIPWYYKLVMQETITFLLIYKNENVMNCNKLQCFAAKLAK